MTGRGIEQVLAQPGRAALHEALVREAVEHWQALSAPWPLQPVPGLSPLQAALRPLGGVRSGAG